LGNIEAGLPDDLKDSRVLVVEDEYFIAQDLARAVLDLGAAVVGPVGSAAEALRLLDTDPPDFAVLDINLQGEVDFAVARRATAAGIPFVFATGYEQGILPADLRQVPVWKKPFDSDDLAGALALIRRAASPGPEGHRPPGG
jgi:CheY-like chemotaxis protein